MAEEESSAEEEAGEEQERRAQAGKCVWGKAERSWSEGRRQTESMLITCRACGARGEQDRLGAAPGPRPFSSSAPTTRRRSPSTARSRHSALDSDASGLVTRGGEANLKIESG